MLWQVCWRVFDREGWLSTRRDDARDLADRELALREHIVSCSMWEKVADVLSAFPRATMVEHRVSFALPRSGIRIETELDFLNGIVWVRAIESI
jgi:HigB_toxin, RelE-like toxic component of a toxin-antitoxin system